MKKTKTTKLFYDKFPYRVILQMHALRYYRWHPQTVDKSSLKRVHKLKELIQSFDEKEVKIRLEHNISIFFKNLKILETISKDFKDVIIEFTEPEDDQLLEFMNDNRLVEIKSTLPYGCRYKVYVGFHESTNPDSKSNFLKSVERTPQNFKITDKVKKQLLVNRPWYSQYYFYVKDTGTLTMTHLMLGQTIKKVIEIKLKEEILENEHA